MTGAFAVGNDIVDLTDPRCVGKAADARFLARVLAAEERDAVTAAADPDLALWIRWAAKEAAFKAATHVLGEPPVFEHAAFVVELPDVGASTGPTERGVVARGVVRWTRWRFPFHIARGRHTDAVHAVASWPEGRTTGAPEGPAPVIVYGSGPVPPGEEIPHERFTERERRALHSAPSAWVRIRAREELAREEGVSERRVEIVCDEGPAGRMPPKALVDGEPARWKVSLSHHGGWLAWAFARSRT